MQSGQNAFANSMLTNLSDIGYNDRDKHSRNINYDVEILIGSNVGPSNTYGYKKCEQVIA